MPQKISEIVRQNILQGNEPIALKRGIDYILHTPYDKSLTQLSIKMANALADNKDMNEVLQEFLVKMDKELTPIIPINVEAIEVKDLGKTYSKGLFEFSKVSFNVNRGTLTGIVGQNGNGKTTLLRMLAGELVGNGDIHYLLLNNQLYDPYSIKEHIGFIPQRIPKWFGKLEDNLIFALSTRGFNANEIETRVEIMLKRLGLYHFRNHFWSEISSGYRTRFELARVLLTNPKILILDEPLANLDIKAQQTFLQDLKFIAKTETNPLAIIFSSQQLHEVEQVADEIIFIKDGKCIFKSKQAEEQQDHNVIEFISNSDFNTVQHYAQEHHLELKSENNFYTLSVPKSKLLKTIIAEMLEADIDLQYFRDITNSTKRLF